MEDAILCFHPEYTAHYNHLMLAHLGVDGVATPDEGARVVELTIRLLQQSCVSYNAFFFELAVRFTTLDAWTAVCATSVGKKDDCREVLLGHTSFYDDVCTLANRASQAWANAYIPSRAASDSTTTQCHKFRAQDNTRQHHSAPYI
jgi:uncharacterized protein YdiU (UPF0061 family)